ncbi:hypothetical protein [Morganella morganii]|uniref:hypothetical protein n=1 Tax=Morganella morganii TaxID=582 RepID=UPI0032DAC314
MKDKKSDIDAIIEYLKDKGAPSFLLERERLDDNGKLSEEEMKIYIEYMVGNKRNIIAIKYLTSCMERFGPGVEEPFAFRYQNVVMDISERVIEKILVNEIERVILDESEDGIFALWRLYTGNELKEKEEGSTWMRDFIDSVLIEAAHKLINSGKSQTIH